jgi:hypothetical protein
MLNACFLKQYGMICTYRLFGMGGNIRLHGLGIWRKILLLRRLDENQFWKIMVKSKDIDLVFLKKIDGI